MICQLDGNLMTSTALPEGVLYHCGFCRGEEFEPADVRGDLQREFGGLA